MKRLNCGMSGKHHTLETKKKISKSLMGHKRHIHTEETKLKISLAHKGKKEKPFSDKHKKNMSLAHMGKTHTKESKIKMCIAWKKRKSITIETKTKMSLSHHGKHHSIETKKKMRDCKLGKSWEEKCGIENAIEIKEKISIGKLGCKNPSWKGGIQFEPYNKYFNNKFKREIRKRDNQICMMCGIHKEKLKRALDVHHINYNKKLSIPQNCISLCRSCHQKTSFNRENWIIFFQSLLYQKYRYEYTKNKEIEIQINKINGN